MKWKLKRGLAACLAVLVCLILMVGFYLWWTVFHLERHEHCIVGVQFWLDEYAEKHDGKYPSSDRGWADALLELSAVSGDDSWIPSFVGVDDHGELFKRALLDHSDIPEAKCTRIYVQGLSRKSNPSLAVLFDRRSIQGGDHIMRGIPGEPKIREVALLGGSHRNIKDANWPAFVSDQKKLLLAEGFAANDIEMIYWIE